MLFNRECPHCKFLRIQESKIVTEKRQKYVIYTCPMCKRSDIERFSDRPRPKVWNGKEFLDDGSYFSDETGEGRSD